MSDLLLTLDTDPALEALVDELDHVRRNSYPLTCAVARWLGPELDHWIKLDALSQSLDFNGLGANWIELPRRSAAKLLSQIIGGELAYPTEVVPREEADALAARFLALFPSGARYFTNGAVSGELAVYDLAGEPVLGWRSLSAAPFDNGVAVVAPGRVGLLWAQDAP
ncbi:MAG: hypothetical protein AB4911_00880 [Oscillochloridaceae bacterium umkhey_bin13]